MTKTPKVACGPHLKKCTGVVGQACCSGSPWPGSIEKAIEMATGPKCLFTVGKDLAKIQHRDGKVYFYGPGTQSGVGLTEIWSFKSVSRYNLDKADSEKA